MYFREMESMGLSFALKLGLHPSTIVYFSNSTSNLPELVSLGPMYPKDYISLFSIVYTRHLSILDIYCMVPKCNMAIAETLPSI
jgi:hypothetical protein